MPNLYPDLSVRRNRRKLPARPTRPYFQTLEYGRAIGFDKRSKAESYWVARFRKKDGNYRHRRIAMTDTEQKADGNQIISFEQAVERARDWFEQPASKAAAIPAISLGPTTTINYDHNASEYTVGAAMVEWAKWKRLQSTEAYYLTAVSRVNYHIIPALGDLPASNMNGEVVRRFITDRLETPPKRGPKPVPGKISIEDMDPEALRKRKKSINAVLSFLRGALEMAWENGHIENDRTWRCVKHLRAVDRPRVLHLSRDECRCLLEVCPPDLRRLVLGALYTGCRFTELIQLRASHVGRDGYGVYIEPVKSLRPRFVFLPDEGMAFFLSLIKAKKPGELVFTRDDHTKWRYNMRHPFKAAIRRAGLPDEFTFHGLRHTYASQLVQSGAPLIVVADQLGHTNTDTVSRTYGHLSPQIRESEVRQRFTPIDGFYCRKAKRDKKKMSQWRESLHGGEWRTYATIHDLVSVSKTRH